MITASNEEVVSKRLSKIQFDMKAFKRASKFLDFKDMGKLQNINLQFRSKSKSRPFPNQTKTILPISEQADYKKAKKRNSVIIFLLSAISIIGYIYECQSTFDSNHSLSLKNNLTRISLLAISILEVLLIIYSSYISFKIKISYKILSKNSKFYQDKATIIKMILEVLICCIVFPPYFSYQLEVYQITVKQTISIEDLLVGLTFLRVIHFYLFYFEFSYYNSLKSRFHCDLQQVDNIFQFTMRCFLKASPFFSLSLMFTLSTLFFGLLLHFYEESVDSSPFSFIWNGFWIVSYSQSTIGYGDIFPKTHLGRLVLIFCVFFGLFLYSYTVFTVRVLTSLSDPEQKLFNSIKHKKIGLNNLNKKAVFLIEQWWTLQMKRKKKASSINDVFKFHSSLMSFSFSRRKEQQVLNPSLLDEIKLICQVPVKKIQHLNSSLNGVKTGESRVSTFINLQVSNCLKISEVCNGCRRSRAASTCSRVALSKMRYKAMKKMIQEKIDKSTVMLSKSDI